MELLLAEGTVPMYYQGVKYNIPVAIWLSEQYPLAAPLAYVVPTPDMIIKPRHSFVEASGACSCMHACVSVLVCICEGLAVHGGAGQLEGAL